MSDRTPSAIKRGRNPAFPYIAVIIRADGSTHNTNTRTAFATREEAVAHAQRWLDHMAERDAANAAAAAERAARWGVEA